MIAISGRLFRYLVIPSAVGAAWLSISTPEAEARPQYLKQFASTYEPLAEAAKSKKCAVCHDKGPKTERNHYGEALAELLGDQKNVKETGAVAKTLKAAEAKPSSQEGKTFGELIKAGVLPE